MPYRLALAGNKIDLFLQAETFPLCKLFHGIGGTFSELYVDNGNLFW